MNVLIIGSLALKYNMMLKGMDHSSIEIKDVDVICKTFDDAAEYIKNLKENIPHISYVTSIKTEGFHTLTEIYFDEKANIHYEITTPYTDFHSTARLFDEHEKFDHIKCGDVMYANINTLFMLKMSHRFIGGKHFVKTAQHIRAMKKLFNPHITNISWYASRCKETSNKSSYSLNMIKDKFFTNNFDYIYDHDSIHEAVAVLDKPAYTYYMKDDQEVMCDESKFANLPPEMRLMGVYEEVCVLALERSQIPNNFTVDPKESYMIALEKVCTTITSGWFRDFAYENYFTLAEMYDECYIRKFKNALEEGLIKPYKDSK